MRRIIGPNPMASLYVKEALVQTNEKVTVDVHELLEYAQLRAQVALHVLNLMLRHNDTAAIGFLTGSLGPTVQLRRIARASFQDRMAMCGGLAHTASNQTVADTEKYLHQVLSRMHKVGMRHITIVDEVVSGGAVRTALKSIERWYQRNQNSGITFEVVGVHDDARPKKPSLADLRTDLLSNYIHLGAVTSVTFFRVPRLLEKDKPGLSFRAFDFDHANGAYTAIRESPFSLALRCPANGNIQLYLPGGSVDQVFGCAIENALGLRQGMSARVFVRSVRGAGCSDCRRLLNGASSLGQPLRPYV